MISTDSTKDGRDEDLEIGDATGRQIDARGPRTKLPLAAISVFWLAVFTYSAAVQYNDKKTGAWTVFYALHALIPLLVLFATFRSLPALPITSLSLSMAMWSLVFVGITSKKLADYSSEENDGEELSREQHGYEVAGAAISFASATYHLVLIHFCFRKHPTSESS